MPAGSINREVKLLRAIQEWRPGECVDTDRLGCETLDLSRISNTKRSWPARPGQPGTWLRSPTAEALALKAGHVWVRLPREPPISRSLPGRPTVRRRSLASVISVRVRAWQHRELEAWTDGGMADAPALGAGAFGREGSNPSRSTSHLNHREERLPYTQEVAGSSPAGTTSRGAPSDVALPRGESLGAGGSRPVPVKVSSGSLIIVNAAECVMPGRHGTLRRASTLSS